jgi:NADH-quinone oxidoreductase subunit N
MVVVGSVIGLYYYLRIILAMAQSPEGGEETPGGWRERWLSYGLTALLVVLGIYPAPLVDWLPVL